MPVQDTHASGQPFADTDFDPLVDLDSLSESQWRALVARRLESGAARMTQTDDLIAANTALTREVWDGTAEIRDIVLMGKSFFSGLNKFARGCARVWAVLKPIVQAGAVMAGAYVAIRGALWTFTHGGQPPTK